MDQGGLGVLGDEQSGVGDADRGWMHRQRARIGGFSKFYQNSNFVLNVFLFGQRSIWRLLNKSKRPAGVRNRWKHRPPTRSAKVSDPYVNFVMYVGLPVAPHKNIKCIHDFICYIDLTNEHLHT